jgi:hypothetical protein
MVKIKSVVAALLLVVTPNMAVAAEDEPGQKSKSARKALIILGHIGADSKEVRNLVEKIDSRIEGDYFTIGKERVENGTIRLHYRLGEGVSLKNVELQYAPDNSNWNATARPDSVMINYSYKF